MRGGLEMANPWWWDNGTQTFEVSSHAVGAAKEAMALAAEEGLLDPRIRRMTQRIAASKAAGPRVKGGEQGRPRRERPGRDRGRRGRGRGGPGREAGLDEER
jgi:hypothetical protein